MAAGPRQWVRWRPMKRTRDIIDAARAITLYGLFLERLARSPQAVAYVDYDRRSAAWTTFTWQRLAARVARWQDALAREGLAPGTRVALSLRNGVDWVAFDLAALGLGLVTVPLYTDDRPDSIAFILENAGAALVLVQDELRYRRLAEALGHSHVERILVLDAGDDDSLSAADPRVRKVADWLPDTGELRQATPEPDALATLVYTSGTTGRPKGVMLSHHNILSVVESGLQVVDVFTEDRFLSFLPLSHAFERSVGYYLPMAAGAQVVFARSVATLADDLRTQCPMVITAVPRIFERIHARLTARLAAASAFERRLFETTVRVGWSRFLHGQRRGRWYPGHLLWPLLDVLVARKVRARMGGCLRLVVSGGAALAPEVARVFIGLGVPVLQGYGMTETAPQLSVNRLHDNDPASVGLPLPGVQVRLGDDDELLVRGPGVTRGYWKNPEATAALLRDGWLHTGDQARLENGRIYIIGRIKDVLVLSNGEKVPPAEMELAISLDPLFEQVMVLGEGRPFLAAIIVLNEEQWPAFAAQHGRAADDPESLTDRDVWHEVVHRVQRRLHDFPAWAKVRRVHLTRQPMTVDNGLLTPTLKVKRAAVLARYAQEVDAIYAEPLAGTRKEHGGKAR